VSASASAAAPAPDAAPAPGAAPRRRTVLALAVAAAVVIVALVVVAVRGPGGPPTFQERVHQVAKGLRCPVCQNLSVADSPSELARQMRTEIALRLRNGESEAQIDAFFTAKYGRWILLTPSAGGVGLFVWLAPALAVAVGVGVAWSVLRRRRGRPATEAVGPVATANGSATTDLHAPTRATTGGRATTGAATSGDAELHLTPAQRAEVQREVDALDLRDDG
jgi:cytochrome c-type biogenesis protein CcmH